jgi:hypothetical protein
MNKEPQISPLRCAPVPRHTGAGEMTILSEDEIGVSKRNSKTSVQQPLSTEPSPFPLPSRREFPATLNWTRSRVRFFLKEGAHEVRQCHEVPQEIRGSVVERSAVLPSIEV